jgi:nitrile hydratase
MNGPHDLGGQMGFGPVAPEPNEPVFHAAWERRALGLTLCANYLGAWTGDEGRHAREQLHPATYYRSSYYEIWIRAIENVLQRHGFITAADLAAGKPVDPTATPRRTLAADFVPTLLARGTPYNRPLDTAPAFAVGDRVRARNVHPQHHTRLPRYARGKLGNIESVHDGFVFPDTNAHAGGEQPQRLYTVVFTAPELWGPDADPTSTVSIDAFESYLERA